MLSSLAVVYPDHYLDQLSDLTGQTYPVGGLFLVAGCGFIIMFGTTMLLPNVQWWYPLLNVAFFAGVRCIHQVLVSLFDFT